MDESAAVAWLHRRAGFGAHPDELAAGYERGPVAELTRLAAQADGPPADPWSTTALQDERGEGAAAVAAWISHLVSSDRSFVDRRTWVLHGWLVSSLAKVASPRLMADQIRLFAVRGGGSYPELLRSITIDPAMLVYLDGRTSTGAAPNENYARELLELFGLGFGRYVEADVQAAARALTGWVGGPRRPATFVPSRHDDTPHTFLGVGGVNDLDSVIDAVVSHPGHPRFVAERIAAEYLGPPDDPALDGVVEELASTYDASERRLDAVIVRALELGLDGATTPIVVGPLAWMIGAMRSCGVAVRELGRGSAANVRNLGQVPLLPPDVSGWPAGDAWFTTSSILARAHLAVAIARATDPSEPLAVALDDRDLDLAARLLGHPEPFGAGTANALRGARDPVDRLSIALVCPEQLLS